MTSREFKDKKKEIEVKGQKLLWKRELKELRKSYKEPKRHIQTSKILAFLIILLIMANSIWIEFSAIWLMYTQNNLESLGTLITIGIGSSFAMILDLAIYSFKSFAETREEEKIKLEREKIEMNQGIFDDNAVG